MQCEEERRIAHGAGRPLGRVDEDEARVARARGALEARDAVGTERHELRLRVASQRSGRRHELARDEPEHGLLTRADRPDDRAELARFDAEVGVAHPAAAETV